MTQKPKIKPKFQFKKTLQRVVKYARHPYGVAVIGSISLHLALAIAFPGWSEPSESTEESQETVRVVELPANLQSRLPSLEPPIDLSVFSQTPDFNLNLNGMNNGAIAPGTMGLNGEFPSGASIYPGYYGQNLNNLPVPSPPNSIPKNFSLTPITPSYQSNSSIAPPPPSIFRGLLPPPPPNLLPSSGSFTPTDSGSSNSSVASNNPDGRQQAFNILPQSGDEDRQALIERQRQLEAANSLDPNVKFDANLLQPGDNQALQNPANLLPRSQSPGSIKAGQLLENPDNLRAALPESKPAERNSQTVNRLLSGAYPQSACNSKASGTAIYNVVVSPNGRPTQWSLQSSSGSSILDNQSQQEIRNARFNGENSNYRVSVAYRYQASLCPTVEAAPQAPQPKPAPASTSTPKPASTPKPTATPPSQPAPVSTPLPIQPQPRSTEPTFKIVPQPTPKPASTPAPAPASAPAPAPAPKVTPSPAPAPAPKSKPAPAQEESLPPSAPAPKVTPAPSSTPETP